MSSGFDFGAEVRRIQEEVSPEWVSPEAYLDEAIKRSLERAYEAGYAEAAKEERGLEGYVPQGPLTSLSYADWRKIYQGKP